MTFPSMLTVSIVSAYHTTGFCTVYLTSNLLHVIKEHKVNYAYINNDIIMLVQLLMLLKLLYYNNNWTILLNSIT